MKSVIFFILAFILLISLSSSAEGQNDMPPLTKFQKEIREEGYSESKITSMFILVISGTILSVLFFRKNIRKKNF